MANISNWEDPHFDFCPPASTLNQKPKQNTWSYLGSIDISKRMGPDHKTFLAQSNSLE